MSESILKSILKDSSRLEWDKYENVPEHKFSLKHRLGMKRIFKLYEKNTRKTHLSETPKPKKYRLTRRTVLTAIVIVFLAALAGCAAAHFISQSFRGDVHSDYTRIFPIDTENCPETIEEKYYLSEIPERFVLLETDPTLFSVYTCYIDYSTRETITFQQYIKTDFGTHNLNTEHHQIEEIDVNGHVGLCVDFSDSEQTCSLLMWDNGDYIFEVSADFSKDILIKLAKSTKPCEK